MHRPQPTGVHQAIVGHSSARQGPQQGSALESLRSLGGPRWGSLGCCLVVVVVVGSSSSSHDTDTRERACGAQRAPNTIPLATWNMVESALLNCVQGGEPVA